MDINEFLEFQRTPILGCWYCSSKSCCLTHKNDDIKKAFCKERDPYKNIRLRQNTIIIVNPDFSQYIGHNNLLLNKQA